MMQALGVSLDVIDRCQNHVLAGSRVRRCRRRRRIDPVAEMSLTQSYSSQTITCFRLVLFLEGQSYIGTWVNSASASIAIIFAPMDYDAAGAPIARATEAKIPVVSSVTRAGSDQLFGYVGTNDVEGGQLIARLATKLLNGKGNVVLLEGPIGNSPQLLRRKGIDEVLAANPDIHLLASKTANWSRAEGLAVMENWLSLYGNKVQAIIAENDAMALGAIEALRSKNIDPKTVPVISLDGVPDAQRAVQDGLLYTFYKDPLAEGQGAMDLAIRSVAEPSYQPKAALWAEGTKWQEGLGKDYDVPWIPLTQENVANFQKQ